MALGLKPKAAVNDSPTYVQAEEILRTILVAITQVRNAGNVAGTVDKAIIAVGKLPLASKNNVLFKEELGQRLRSYLTLLLQKKPAYQQMINSFAGMVGLFNERVSKMMRKVRMIVFLAYICALQV